MTKNLKAWVIEILEVQPEATAESIANSMHNKRSVGEIMKVLKEIEREEGGTLLSNTLDPEIMVGDKTLESVTEFGEKQKKKGK